VPRSAGESSDPKPVYRKSSFGLLAWSACVTKSMENQQNGLREWGGIILYGLRKSTNQKKNQQMACLCGLRNIDVFLPACVA